MHTHHYPRWIPYCTSVYTMDAIREMRAKQEAEGYATRVDHKGKHLAGDGTYKSFGKLFIQCNCTKQEA